MKSGIYEILNTVNGRRYIGSAASFRTRFAVHRHHLRNGCHHSRYLQRAFDKYGESAFRFGKLLICAKQNLVFYEQRAIDALSPEYNHARIAGSMVGYRHTDETRRRMSEAQARVAHFRGRTHSEETLLLMSESKKGNTHTKGKKRDPDAVEKTAAAHRGMKRSPETRAKISAKALGRKRSRESIERGAAKRRGVKLAPEHAAKLIGNKHAAGLRHTDEWKAAASARALAMWNDPVKRQDILARRKEARERRKSAS